MTRYIFILNPYAGKRDQTRQIREKLEVLKQRYLIEVVTTQYKGHATDIVVEKAKTYSEKLYIYACGGDGTLNEVVNGAWMYPHVSVGIIPIGSGNDFVRSFEDVPQENFLDLEKMINGNSVPVDLLFVGKKAGINVVSVGYDCAVAKEMERFKSWSVLSGTMAYKLSLIYCLISKMKHEFTLVADGKPVKDISNQYLFALAANGKFYGGGFKAAPKAKLSDGYIDFIRVPVISRCKFLRMVGKYKKGKHFDDPKMDFIRLERCKKLQILSHTDVDINIDGEIMQVKNPEIVLKRHAVKLIVPIKTVKYKKPEISVSFLKKNVTAAVIAKEKNG